MNFTAVRECEGDGHVSLYPEPDIANQGDSINAAPEKMRFLPV